MLVDTGISAGDPKTTFWGVLGAFGTAISGASVLMPAPFNLGFFIGGQVISAVCKSIQSVSIPDKETVVKKEDLLQNPPPIITP